MAALRPGLTVLTICWAATLAWGSAQDQPVQGYGAETGPRKPPIFGREKPVNRAVRCLVSSDGLIICPKILRAYPVKGQQLYGPEPESRQLDAPLGEDMIGYSDPGGDLGAAPASEGEPTTTDDSAAAAPPPAQTQITRAAPVVLKAKTLAKALQRSIQDEDIAWQSPQGSPRSASEPQGNNPSNLSATNPTTSRDFLLASVSGFAATFRQLGLRVGSTAQGLPVVLREDGRPASPREVKDLKNSISAQPAALVRRPDFFTIVAPEHYTSLKARYSANPAERAEFKHIKLSSNDRDFQWANSCSPLSGDCNPHTEKTYKKGEFVAPETLEKIWRHSRGATTPSGHTRVRAKPAPLPLRNAFQGRLLASIAKMLDSVQDFLGNAQGWGAGKGSVGSPAAAARLSQRSARLPSKSKGLASPTVPTPAEADATAAPSQSATIWLLLVLACAAALAARWRYY